MSWPYWKKFLLGLGLLIVSPVAIALIAIAYFVFVGAIFLNLARVTS